MVVNTPKNHKFSICYYNTDDNKALTSLEIHVKSTKWTA